MDKTIIIINTIDYLLSVLIPSHYPLSLEKEKELHCKIKIITKFLYNKEEKKLTAKMAKKMYEVLCQVASTHCKIYDDEEEKKIQILLKDINDYFKNFLKVKSKRKLKIKIVKMRYRDD